MPWICALKARQLEVVHEQMSWQLIFLPKIIEKVGPTLCWVADAKESGLLQSFLKLLLDERNISGVGIGPPNFMQGRFFIQVFKLGAQKLSNFARSEIEEVA